MAKTSEDSGFSIAKALREKIFKIPLLPQEQIVQRFKEIDALLYRHTIELTERLPLLRYYFVDIVHRVASGNTLGKNYFNKQDNEDTDKKKKHILKNSELRILSQTLPLLKYQNQPKRFSKILAGAGFMRGVMEEGLEFFMETVKDLPEIERELQRTAKEGCLTYIEYELKQQRILESLGHKEVSDILEWYRKTEEIWNQYLELREKIIAPYYRIVYKLAKTSSDAQTLNNFQNGLLGLIRAFKCYTPSRYAAFSLVAKDWINQSIRLNLKSEVNFIKLPIANWHLFQKLEKIRIQIENRTNKEASMEAIALEAKIPVDKVKKIYENVKIAKVLSLNLPTTNEEEQSDGPTWSLESIESPYSIESQLEIESEFNIVKSVVDMFDEEERVIFGFISGCLDLISNEDLNPVEVEKEKIRQRAARVGIEVSFK